MTNWQTRLVLTGLILVFAGFLFGLAFSLSVDHQPRLVAHEAYEPVFEQIGTGVSEEMWRGTAAAISQVSIAHRRAAAVHGHLTNMGIVLMLVGLLAPLLAMARDRAQEAGAAGGKEGGAGSALLAGLVASAIVYPMGLFLQFLRFTLAGEIVAALGAVGVITCLAGFYLRLCKGVDRLAE